MPYCTQCGKKLEEGEICTCQQGTPVSDGNEFESQETPAYDQETPGFGQEESDFQEEKTVKVNRAGSEQLPADSSSPWRSDRQSGYQQNGYQNGYQQNGYQNGYQQNGYQNSYQQNGYQQNGYQQNGYQQNGYRQNGYQQNGYQQNGYQQNGYRQNGNQQAEWLNQKAGQFAAGTKNMFAEILPILKNPVTRVRQINSADNTSVGIEFIVAKMIAYILVAILAIVRVRSQMGFLSDYVEIPVFRILSLIIILTAGIDFLEALLMRAFAGITHGSASFAGTLITVGVKDLYETLIFLICGLIALVFPVFGIVLGILLTVIVPYIEYHAYVAAVQGEEDRKPYAYFLVKICMILILFVLVMLLAGDLISTVAGSSFSDILYDIL